MRLPQAWTKSAVFPIKKRENSEQGKDDARPNCTVHIPIAKSCMGNVSSED